MSAAISIPTLPTTEPLLRIEALPVEDLAAGGNTPEEPLHAEESLVAAVVEYERLYVFLRRMEKSFARQISNQLDVSMEVGPKREALRMQVLDALAQQRREIMSWVRTARAE